MDRITLNLLVEFDKGWAISMVMLVLEELQHYFKSHFQQAPRNDLMNLCLRHWENAKWIATLATNKHCQDWTESVLDFGFECHHQWGRSRSLRYISCNYQDPLGWAFCHCTQTGRLIPVSLTELRWVRGGKCPLNLTNPPCFPNNISSVRAPLDHWDVLLNKTKCCRCRPTVAPFIMWRANSLRRNSVCGSTLSGLPPRKCTVGPHTSRTLSLQLAPLSRHILAQSQFYTYLVT